LWIQSLICDQKLLAAAKPLQSYYLYRW